MKGKDLKGDIFTINIDDITYSLCFDFNAMCELEDVFGSIQEYEKQAKESQKTGKGVLKLTRIMFYCMTVLRHPDMTIERAGELLGICSKNKEKSDELKSVIRKTMEAARPKETEKNSPCPPKKTKGKK